MKSFAAGCRVLGRWKPARFFCSFILFGAAMNACSLAAATAGESTTQPATSPSTLLDVRALGAAGDGQTLDTKAIQAAIGQCNLSGGGVVDLPGGDKSRYVTGTLYLKSNVTLRGPPNGDIVRISR